MFLIVTCSPYNKVLKAAPLSVATGVQDVSPPGRNSLVDQSWTDKAPRPQTLEFLLLLLCLCLLSATLFLWYLASC